MTAHSTTCDWTSEQPAAQDLHASGASSRRSWHEIEIRRALREVSIPRRGGPARYRHQPGRTSKDAVRGAAGDSRMLERLGREDGHGRGPDGEMGRRLGDDLAIRIDRARPRVRMSNSLARIARTSSQAPCSPIAERARHEGELPGALQLQAVEIEMLVVDGGILLDRIAAAVEAPVADGDLQRPHAHGLVLAGDGGAERAARASERSGPPAHSRGAPSGA